MSQMSNAWPAAGSRFSVNGTIERSLSFQDSMYEPTSCLWLGMPTGNAICCWLTEGYHTTKLAPVFEPGAQVSVQGLMRYGFADDTRGFYRRFAYVETEQVTSSAGSWKRSRNPSRSSRHFPCAMSAWWSGEWLPALQILQRLAAREPRAEAVSNSYVQIVRSVAAAPNVTGPIPSWLEDYPARAKDQHSIWDVLFMELVGDAAVRKAMYEPLVKDFALYLRQQLLDLAEAHPSLRVVRSKPTLFSRQPPTVFYEALDERNKREVGQLLLSTNLSPCVLVILGLDLEDGEEAIPVWKDLTSRGNAVCILSELLGSVRSGPRFIDYMREIWYAPPVFWDGGPLENVHLV